MLVDLFRTRHLWRYDRHLGFGDDLLRRLRILQRLVAAHREWLWVPLEILVGIGNGLLDFDSAVLHRVFEDLVVVGVE